MGYNMYAKVWPLIPGLKGVDGLGEPIDLIPGRAGFMLYDEAVEADKAGTVQLMVGQTPDSLKQYETKVVESKPESGPTRTSKRRKTYGDRNMRVDS